MKLLLLQHVPHEHPGYISQYANEKNIALDILKLWKPYTIPNIEKIEKYDGLIILGGPMGVYENYPCKEDELKIVKNAVGKIPTLGLCLGSQLLAHALGAKVAPNLKNGKHVKEVGYYTVRLTEQGKDNPILKNFSSPITVLQWHGDAFELPQGATLLATFPLCTNQAFAYKNAYGLLFHFEFTPEMVAKQIEIDRKWIHKDNEVDEKKLITEAWAYEDLMKKQTYQLLDNFLSMA